VQAAANDPGRARTAMAKELLEEGRKCVPAYREAQAKLVGPKKRSRVAAGRTDRGN
jgi:hypothetical protein